MQSNERALFTQGPTQAQLIGAQILASPSFGFIFEKAWNSEDEEHIDELLAILTNVASELQLSSADYHFDPQAR